MATKSKTPMSAKQKMMMKEKEMLKGYAKKKAAKKR